ncbi:hypothetical protein [Nocardioides sp.]|uniref:hypothetical protein n=1 Tax=Nocardioides sp. TaxID=35761 RepID=UPI002735B66D|nr:hypothetical protein [Nocardioides sp.]MDP3891737.1 hypothetical protein [Nocardioides sp.]
MSKNKIRSTDMNLQHEALSRAQTSERLGEAQEIRRMQTIAAAARLSREAERKVYMARLSIARALM